MQHLISATAARARRSISGIVSLLGLALLVVITATGGALAAQVLITRQDGTVNIFTTSGATEEIKVQQGDKVEVLGATLIAARVDGNNYLVTLVEPDGSSVEITFVDLFRLFVAGDPAITPTGHNATTLVIGDEQIANLIDALGNVATASAPLSASDPGPEPPRAPEIPAFPWPPPKASASVVLERSQVLSLWYEQWDRNKDKWKSWVDQRDLSELQDWDGTHDSRKLEILRLELYRSGETGPWRLGNPRLYWMYERAGSLLGHVDFALQRALNTGGYLTFSYYTVPEGFALATQLEQINEDRTPKQPARNRWSTELVPLNEFSLGGYFKALFRANPGFFRVIVFVVTSQPFSESDATVSREEAIAWLDRGNKWLPERIKLRPFTPAHNVTALIYEFEKSKVVETEPRFILESLVPAIQQLQISGVFEVKK
jgi:hypothetical protein